MGCGDAGADADGDSLFISCSMVAGGSRDGDMGGERGGERVAIDEWAEVAAVNADGDMGGELGENPFNALLESAVGTSSLSLFHSSLSSSSTSMEAVLVVRFATALDVSLCLSCCEPLFGFA